MVLVSLAFLIQPVNYFGEMSQSKSLDNLVNQFSVVNFGRASPNFYKLRGNLSQPPWLPPIAASQTLIRVIVTCNICIR